MTQEQLLETLRQILWPADNPDRDWSAETLDNVANALEDAGYGRPTEPTPTAYVIPVAFEVVDVNEASAADRVVNILQQQALIDRYPELQSWWTPNHPDADGSDDEQDRLVWAPAE